MLDSTSLGLAASAQGALEMTGLDASAGSQTVSSGSLFVEATGALTADTTLTLTAAGVQRIKNSTTGAYKLSVKRGAAGVPLTIPQNETIEVR